MPVQVTAVIAAAVLIYYAYYYHDHLHYHVSRGYAHLGYADAQHVVAHRLLHGNALKIFFVFS
jgi:hypothetical protein